MKAGLANSGLNPTECSLENRALLWTIGDFQKNPADSPSFAAFSNFDWQTLRRLALHHGILPMLHDKLKNRALAEIPEREMAEIRRLYLKNAARNLLLTRMLIRLLRLFADNGIDSIPFKGPSLAALAYGSISKRRFSDLDILVRRRDIGKISDLLISQGFVPTFRFSELQRRIHLRFTCELGFIHPEENIHVEVHWKFAAEYLAPGLAVIDPFAHTRRFRLEGAEIETLSADILLLYLCLHGTFHLWTSLSYVKDIARVVETGVPWRWDELLKMGEETGLLRMLLLGLTLARDLCAVKLPPVVCDRIAGDSRLNRLRRHALRSLFSRRTDLPGFRELAAFQMRALDRAPDRIRYFLLRLFLPTVEDWKRIRLPDGLFFLYFFTRQLRLVRNMLIRPPRVPPAPVD